MRTLTCVDCGAVFDTTNYRTVRCDKCRVEYRKKQVYEYNKIYRENLRNERIKKIQLLQQEPEKKPKKKKKIPIEKIVELADQAGMSYGQYVSKYGFPK